MFKDKVVVVTGGAQGIGRGLTCGFANEGAKVAFIDKEDQAGRELERELTSQSHQVYFFAGDLSSQSDLRDFVDSVVETFGQVDCLINNAMESQGGILSGCSYEAFNKVLRIGVTAPFILSQWLLPHFSEQGVIINISSSRAFMSQADTEAYTAAKGGITALTHAMAVSLAGRVRVNSIAPGWIDTGMDYDSSYHPNYSLADSLQHPSQRVGNSQDILRACLFLCNPQNSFINGENITIDGGMSKLMIYHDDHGWSYQPESER